MNKKRIAICNLLKPVDEPRCFEKLAYSLGKGNKYDINIIGYASKSKNTLANVSLRPVFTFRRNSVLRLFAGAIMFRKLIQVKPELIIVNTTELLTVIFLYRILFGSKIIYDIQEDIFKNIRSRKGITKPVRFALSGLMRLKEKAFAPFFDHFIVAEKIYLRDIPYLRTRPVTVLTNNFNHELFEELKTGSKQDDKTVFVFAGTIAREFGILEAIKLIQSLYKVDNSVRMVIIGQYHDSNLMNEISERIKDQDYIETRISHSFIDHSEIIKAVSGADYGLSSYHNIPSIQGKEPTTLFEYIALKKPVVINLASVGNSMVEEYKAGIAVDFSNPPKDLIRRLETEEYYSNDNHRESLWMTENHHTLLNLIEKVLGEED